MRLRGVLVVALVLSLSPAHAATQASFFQRTKQAITGKWLGAIVKMQRIVNARRVRTGEVFRRIASGDAAGHHILYVDPEVTAFVSWADPASPNYNPHTALDPLLAAYPIERRAHILLIPNHGYQHIGETLAQPIYLSDVRRTANIMERAQTIARQLHLKNIQIFENSEQMISVGYQHIHIVGEKDPLHPYPTTLLPTVP